ncbi:DUF4037 domain-containing protein [Collinsella sp. D33t1_170424_A12]|uniref:DUF4037 domain-containing protein n=1 Tax=Collinsella sp. D33t1_170424_A12 TaxID=2787135 RepID=UPI00189B19D2|nr:DUF4037 domain-containing protein [Collinsella sp. D33t1_170424_A12]
MKGLELARAYCDAYAESLFDGMPAGLMQRCALGLVGPGSECLGFDDEISRDHDFGPGFCIWLEPADFAAYGAELQRRYDALPAEFRGYRRVATPLSGQRVGVFDADAFRLRYTGLDRAPETSREWLFIPQQLLAEYTAGSVFFDPAGVMACRRGAYQSFYPEQVIRKKVAAECAAMAQAGQYNLPRCIRRHDLVAANAARSQFVTSTMAVMHLFGRVYMPFYKWSFSSLRERVRVPAPVVQNLEFIAGAAVGELPQERVELLCRLVAQTVRRLGWAHGEDDFLLAIAMEVCQGIDDPYLASLPVAAGSYS